jgi:hypothetical protein
MAAGSGASLRRRGAAVKPAAIRRTAEDWRGAGASRLSPGRSSSIQVEFVIEVSSPSY